LCLEKDILMSQPQNAVVPEDRACAAERLAAENRQFAILGRYMVEMRHGFNNAMTSLLGNAELLLQDPGAYPARVLEQLQTIRAMALRMHQMMQRFSALEAEMEIGESNSSESAPPIVQRKVGT
jgi:signal transduction histidine kinase